MKLGGEVGHKKFKKHLMASKKAVDIVAAQFRQSGYEVSVPVTKVAPNYSNWEEYADDGDLFVTLRDSKVIRVEVKGLRYKFTCRADWPFAHGNTVVCARHAWDRAKQKPSMFILTNGAMDHVAIVKASTEKYWFKKVLGDPRYGSEYKQEFYMVSTDKAVFRRMKELCQK